MCLHHQRSYLTDTSTSTSKRSSNSTQQQGLHAHHGTGEASIDPAPPPPPTIPRSSLTQVLSSLPPLVHVSPPRRRRTALHAAAVGGRGVLRACFGSRSCAASRRKGMGPAICDAHAVQRTITNTRAKISYIVRYRYRFMYECMHM